MATHLSDGYRKISHDSVLFHAYFRYEGFQYNVITARKRSLRRLGFTRVCHSVYKGGGGGIPACLAGGVPVCLAAVPQGEGWYPSMPGRFPGPHPGGKLRGLARGVSRRTPKGEVEGSDLGGGSPGPHPGGSPSPHLGGLQAHTRGGCIPACTEADPPRQRLLLPAVRIVVECILV